MAGQQVIVSVLSDVKEFSKGMTTVSDNASSTFGKIGGLIAGAFSIAAVATWTKDVSSKFMEIEDNLGNIGVQMGEKTAKHFNSAFSGNLADIGLSKVDAMNLGSMLSTTFAQAGLSGKDLEGTIVRIRDISGATGKDNESIAQAWESAERGKYMAMEKTLGLSKGTMKALVEQKMKQDGLTEAEARHAVLMDQTAKTKGEAAKDAQTLGGQLEILRAKWDNMGQIVAEKVMPYVIDFSAWINDTALPELQELGTWLVQNKDWLTALGLAVGVAVLAFQGLAAIQAAIGVFQALKSATLAQTLAQWGLNAALLANPITWIVVGIAALVAGLIYFFTQTEVGKQAWTTFSKAMGDTWEVIKGAFEAGWQAVTGFLGKVWDYIKLVWNYSPYGLIVNNWSKIMDFFGSIPGAIKGWFDSAINWLKSAGENILKGLQNGVTGAWTAVSSWFGEMNTKIIKAIGNAAGWLVDSGKNVVEGLWKGISNGYEWIRDKISGWVSNVINFFKDKLGIHSPSTVAASMGAYWVEGLANGITNNLGLAQSAVDALGDKLTGTDLASQTLKSGGTVNQYFIDGVELNLTPEEEEQFGEILNKFKAGV